MQKVLSKIIIKICIVIYTFAILVIKKYICCIIKFFKMVKNKLTNLFRKIATLWGRKFREEHFFYNNLITIIQFTLSYLSIAVSICITLSILIAAMNTKLTGQEYGFWEIIFSTTLAFAVSFICSHVFFTISTLKKERQKDIIALNILTVIAKCHLAFKHIEEYSNKSLNSENNCEDYTQRYFLKINSYLQHQITIGYHLSTSVKPSLINLLGIIDHASNNFEELIKIERCIDIIQLKNIDLCHNFLYNGDVDNILKLNSVVIYADMQKVIVEYKKIYIKESQNQYAMCLHNVA